MTNKGNTKQRVVERCYNISVSLPMWLIFKIDEATKESERSKLIKYAVMKELGLGDMIEQEKKKDEESKKLAGKLLNDIKK